MTAAAAVATGGGHGGADVGAEAENPRQETSGRTRVDGGQRFLKGAWRT